MSTTAQTKPVTKKQAQKKLVQDIEKQFSIATNKTGQKRLLSNQWGEIFHHTVAVQDGEHASLKSWEVTSESGKTTKVALAKGIVPSKMSDFPAEMKPAEKKLASALITALRPLHGFGLMVYRYESEKGVSFYATVTLISK